jgi:hypothetical protein
MVVLVAAWPVTGPLVVLTVGASSLLCREVAEVKEATRATTVKMAGFIFTRETGQRTFKD